MSDALENIIRHQSYRANNLKRFNHLFNIQSSVSSKESK